jgi:hypothetical protein
VVTFLLIEIQTEDALQTSERPATLSRAGTMVWFKITVIERLGYRASHSFISKMRALLLHSDCGKYRTNCRHAVPFTATDGRLPDALQTSKFWSG